MEKQISSIISQAIGSGQAVGASCLVYKGDDELYSGTFGFADREAGVPMNRNTICRLFSLSKPITSAAAMILMDKGLLSPDMLLKDIFPEFSGMVCLDNNGEVTACRNDITILHLLTMTSGLCYANNFNKAVCSSGKLFDQIIERQENGTDMTTSEFARNSGDLILAFEPGTRWDYGISADIMGAVIEKLSGMRYSDFLRVNIFEPLGMNDTGFFVPEDKRSRFAALYNWKDGALTADHNNYLGLTDYTRPPAFESGGAGLVSTIDDYSRFARCLTNGGEFQGVRLMSEKAFQFMTAPRLTSEQNALWDRLSGYNYGCFVRIMTDPDIAQIKTGKGELGWDGWTGTYFSADPATGITTLYFTQIAGAGTTWQAAEMNRIVYDCIVRK